ncbi:MAG: VTT domain-containing protein [Lacunisphaera sp.]
MAESSPRSARMLLIKLGVVAAVLIAGAVLVMRGYDVKGLIQQALELVRSAGPVVFFTAQALLPAVGAPQTAFSLTAGPLFGSQLGMPLVVALSTLALAVNIALTYWLASRLLHPVLEKLFLRLGYKLPQVASGNAIDLIVLLRVTPGVPLPVQNYLLGLARVPFGRYLLVSCLILGPLNAAFVLFGDALLQGKGRLAFLALSGLLALMAGAQLLRKHYARKNA